MVWNYFSGPMKIEFAGLNAPIRMRETENQNLMSIAEQTEDEIRDSMGGTKKILEERDT